MGKTFEIECDWCGSKAKSGIHSKVDPDYQGCRSFVDKWFCGSDCVDRWMNASAASADVREGNVTLKGRLLSPRAFLRSAFAVVTRGPIFAAKATVAAVVLYYGWPSIQKIGADVFAQAGRVTGWWG
jgi:hypothetical protein